MGGDDQIANHGDEEQAEEIEDSDQASLAFVLFLNGFLLLSFAVVVPVLVEDRFLHLTGVLVVVGGLSLCHR